MSYWTVVEDEVRPAWAIAAANGLEPGAQLCTKDGRRTGNAVIRGPQVARHGHLVWPVLTDAGNLLHLTDAEVAELFYPPQWVMDQATAPGAITAAAKAEAQ